MSLYNMLFGRNAQSALLLAAVGFRENDVERFRDVSAEDDGKTIAIYTRTGGGNRDDYPNEALTSSPLYSHGEDDDFDSTYRTFYLRTPPEFADDVAKLADPLTHGLRAEFATHLALTMRREPTEADNATAAYEAEREALRRTKHFMANGHTFVPLDDYAMKAALELAEANGGELRSAWGIMPLAITVKTNDKPYPGAKDPDQREHLIRAELGYDYSWKIDSDYWAHCERRFAEAYPLTMAKVREAVAKKLAA